MSEPRKYRKLPVEIEAFELTQFGDFIRAVEWINTNGGSAVFAPANEQHDDDYLLISTLEGTMEAGVGWFVIKGVKGEFYGCEGEIFRMTYAPSETPAPYVEEGTGYTVGRRTVSEPSKSTLVGGAALTLPT